MYNLFVPYVETLTCLSLTFKKCCVSHRNEIFRFCERVMVLWLESVAADLCTNILIPQGKGKMLERAGPTMTTFNKTVAHYRM